MRPFSGSAYSAYWHTASPYTASIADHHLDERPPLVRTARGPWRPPTNYYRNVDLGNIYTYDVQGVDKWVDGYGTWSNTFAGARNASGYHYVPVPSPPASLEGKAVNRALTKLKGQKVNLAQAFAERDQTGRLIGTSLRRIADLIWDIRRTRRALAHTDKDFFNYFLEVQYGWKPAIQDAYGAIHELHEKEQQNARGIATVEAHVREEEIQDSVLSDSANTTVYTYTRRRRIKHKGHVRLDYLQSNGAPVGTFARLGITNPALIAWELLPWSFVADWFVPVGDYLSLLDATVGWNFLGGSYSSKTEVDTTVHNFKANYDQYKPNRSCYVTGHGAGRQMRFARKAYSSSPTPYRPAFKTGSSGIHVANGIALVMAAIVGGSRVR